MNFDLTTNEALIMLGAGAVGAFVRLITRDGCLEMPYLKQGKLYLGFFSALLIGAVVGVIVDGSWIAALSASYMGNSLLDKLAFKNQIKYADKTQI